jgi:hypothetical protein
VETCSICGRPFEAERCPFCEATEREVIDVGKRFILVSLPGLVASLFLYRLFPLLEWPLATIDVMYALFLGPPLFLILLMTFNRRFVLQAARIKRVFKWMPALLIIYVAFCFLNVALDKQPPMEVPAYVVSKESGRGRGGTAYILQLSLTWHQQPLEKEWSVSRQTFSAAEAGDFVRLVVHPGAFSLAWCGDVLVGQ